MLMQVKSKLRGHSKRITGLAFSFVLNVLVSSGADAQVIDQYLLHDADMRHLGELVHLWFFSHRLTSTFFLYGSFARGELMGGRNRKVYFCKFPPGVLYQPSQTHMFSSVKINYAS